MTTKRAAKEAVNMERLRMAAQILISRAEAEGHTVAEVMAEFKREQEEQNRRKRERAALLRSLRHTR